MLVLVSQTLWTRLCSKYSTFLDNKQSIGNGSNMNETLGTKVCVSICYVMLVMTVRFNVS